MKPVLTQEEQTAGFLLTTPSLTVPLLGGPVLDADFSQVDVFSSFYLFAFHIVFDFDFFFFSLSMTHRLVKGLGVD